ncbi:unnamed protein product [Cercopithifilaria johnstoni]|uniref:Uncharacterized protein n=1 Tax=Cercopithifilaria johnstoni TaxID=2874296 RepID=A0A8J2MQ30_9BILA|nr:unnamed protein product [Cercopithifilaria johnstoni]
MSSLLEYNIYLKCIKTVYGIYGISFMNLTTDIPYINLKVRNRTLKIEERQKILVEVIYYCCKSCEQYENKTDEEIIEDLATEFYKHRLKDSDVTEVATFQKNSDYCINVDGEKEISDVSCMFMLDVNIPAKVHFGGMHWNMIDLMKQSSERENNSLVALALRGHFCAIYSVSQIPDGECIRYASLREYFVLCCCYERPELCAYTISNKSMSNVKANRRIWKTNFEVRNYHLANKLRTNVYDTLAHSWTYRDFIYSRPTKFGDQKDFSTIRNVPLWHCAVGEFMVHNTRNYTTTSVELERLKRKDLPFRTEHCIADFWIEFKEGETESTFFEAKADTEGSCNSIESVFCQLVGPRCLNDLLYTSHIKAQYRCCCNRGNLCNHWGNNNPDKSNYQISLKPEDLQNVEFRCHITAIAYLTQVFMKRTNSDLSEICWRSFDFHFEQEILMIGGVSYQSEMIYRVARKEFPDQHYVCEILNTFPLRSQNCHRNDYIHLPITYQFFKCECQQQITYFDLVLDLFLGYRKLTKTCDENMPNHFKKHKFTLKRPACYESYNENGPVTIDLYSFTQKIDFSGIFISKIMTNITPICVTFVRIKRESISFGIYALRPAKVLAEVESSQRFMSFRHQRTNTFIQRCQSNLTTPCNNFKNLVEHMMPLALHLYARDKEPSGYSKCYITDDLQRIDCKTKLGCFDFHSFNGERYRGCIDDIPKLVNEKPELAVLNYCKHAKLWQIRSYICSGVRNITYSHAYTLDGVLCCCKRICPLSNQAQSPTNSNMGFNIFESIS